MALRLIPGVPLQLGLSTLMEVETGASNVPGAGHSFPDVRDAYLTWSVAGARRLQSCFQADGVDALIFSTRYWHLQTGVHATEKSGFDLIAAEVYELAVRFEGERRRLELERARWQLGRLIVLDTSALVHGPQLWDWDPALALGLRDMPIHLVIPILVMDELDGLKESTKQHTRHRARETLRWVSEKLNGRTVARIMPGGTERVDGDVRRVWGDVFLEVLLDQAGHRRLPIADDEIVDGARAVQDLAGRPVTLATNDTAQAFRARLAQIDVVMVDDPVYDLDVREAARKAKDAAKQEQRNRSSDR